MESGVISGQPDRRSFLPGNQPFIVLLIYYLIVLCDGMWIYDDDADDDEKNATSDVTPWKDHWFDANMKGTKTKKVNISPDFSLLWNSHRIFGIIVFWSLFAVLL